MNSDMITLHIGWFRWNDWRWWK